MQTIDGLVTNTTRPCVMEIEDLSVRYGGVRALTSLAFTVSQGEVMGLIGPNGAGKTTALDAMTGFVRSAEGKVVLQGHDVSRLSPDQRAKRGMGRSFQQLELFVDLSVLENMRVYARASSNGNKASIDDALELFELQDLRNALVSELPQGTRRMVAVARALAMNPCLLLLDEPAAGLNKDESDAFGAKIRAMAERGVAVVLVEHDVDLVMNVCDQLVVIDFGAMIASGEPATVRSNPAVIEAYLGIGSQEESVNA